VAEASALERLAERHGVALEYFDIWGARRHATAESLAAILGAMGIDAGDERALAERVRADEARRWRETLPPVAVVRTDRLPARVRLALPAALDAAELAWCLREESGGEHRGGFVPGALRELESASVAGERFVARELELAATLPTGYHRLEVARAGAPIAAMQLAVVPPACYLPPALAGGARVWGAAVQLYAVRSERNWGVGDFTDLRTIVEQWAARGAGVVGVNPLHALFPHDPEHASPYSPSSRLFLNPLYLDVEAIEDLRESGEARAAVRDAAFQARLKALRETDLVDYAGAAAAKREVLERLYAHFRRAHLDRAEPTPRARAFRAFQSREGEPLRRHALFEALQERFHREDPAAWGWPAWPEACRDPAAPEVARRAGELAGRVEFYEYLQWQADEQLAAAGRRSLELGLAVGIYQDLAVSIDRGGAEAWGNQGLYATAAAIGAPPDDFNQKGQNWGLPPLVPDRLRAAAYAPFIATLRANMRHAGALRIDHALGLLRLYWIPEGMDATAGAYVHYPLEDLLGILALESHRNRCLVIGEDLGTVPDEVRRALAATGVLSYRVLLFERAGSGDFKPPGQYPADALVAATTHDLPTLAGWWGGRDVELRHELGLLSAEEAREALVVGRAQDQARLLLALEREALLPPGATPAPVSVPEMTPALAGALHVFLARTPAKVMVVQLEDVIGARDQVNLPATTAERHPNWRHKLALALERWPEDDRFVDLANALVQERGPSRAAPAPRRAAPTAAAAIPRATYRLQLDRDFGFAAATAIVPYLAALGVSHLYCSPYLRARPGSRHGYDIIDHSALNPEIGGTADYERFCRALAEHGLGHILDMVPNHMGVMGADNAWWMDVLEHGEASVYAEFFDIDWHPLDPALAGKVLLPVLGGHYGDALESGELALAWEPDAGAFAVRYHEHRFPVDPREYPRLLERVARLAVPGALPSAAGADFESLAAAFGHLPARTDAGAAARAERRRDGEVHKGRLARLAREHPGLAEAIARAVHQVNGIPREPASFAALHELLEAQAYRLAYWRVAGDEVNYRRFFDVNDLAALRMENEAVFEATHRFVLELAAAGKVQGLRIDHPDGLYDPARYFRRLQERYASLAGVDLAGDDPRPRPLYVVAEKIVAPHERLPETWTVHGTTGYRFANLVHGLFVDAGARGRVDRAWRAFVRDEAVAFEAAAYAGKRAIMRSALAGELTVLARRLLGLARADRHTRDFTLTALQEALAEVVAWFPVYRTYVVARPGPQDRRYIEWAIGRARRHARAIEASVFDFLKSVLLVAPRAGAADALREEARAFALRFQQFTAPVAAKGIEDTALYVCNRLVSLNEVGGHPDDFGTTVPAFHAASADRAAKWPHTMLATSTHDSKRSEDVRARIGVISELPAPWRLAVRRWSRINRSKKRTVEGEPAPSRNDEYLLYQTLLGSFPVPAPAPDALAAYCARIEAYMLKAVREAKVHTSWINPNEAYEAAVAAFVRALLGKADANLFLDDFRAQLAPFAWYGALNSLATTLVKLTSPGVPDLYQGNELIELSLVDPDNRRPVDYALRRARLAELAALAAAPAETLAEQAAALCAQALDGRAKLWITARALALRRARPALFAHGDYHPIGIDGARAGNAVAYARRAGASGIVVVAGRLFASLGLAPGTPPVGASAWGDTAADLGFLPAGTPLASALTGETLRCEAGRLPLARALARFPGALLVYDDAAS